MPLLLPYLKCHKYYCHWKQILICHHVVWGVSANTDHPHSSWLVASISHLSPRGVGSEGRFGEYWSSTFPRSQHLLPRGVGPEGSFGEYWSSTLPLIVTEYSFRFAVVAAIFSEHTMLKEKGLLETDPWLKKTPLQTFVSWLKWLNIVPCNLSNDFKT